MKRFTGAGVRALKDSNLYAALSIALVIPDICGSLEDPGPGKSEARYTGWYAKWVEPKFTHKIGGGETVCFLSAADCYQLRNSLIHSGSTEIDSKKSKLKKAEFFDNTTGNHMNMINDWLQLEAAQFSQTMFESAEEWDKAVAGDAAIQKRKESLLVIHTAGAVIRGVKFGKLGF